MGQRFTSLWLYLVCFSELFGESIYFCYMVVDLNNQGKNVNSVEKLDFLLRVFFMSFQGIFCVYFFLLFDIYYRNDLFICLFF